MHKRKPTEACCFLKEKSLSWRIVCSCISFTDAELAGLTMGRLMWTIDLQVLRRPEPSVQSFTVTFYSYLLHQVVHEDVDVLGRDLRILHWCWGALLAVLTEASHLDHALSPYKAHVEDHHHPVGRPASPTLSAPEPGKWQETQVKDKMTTKHTYTGMCHVH